MASRKAFLVKPGSIFATTSNTHFHPDSTEAVSEFDEAELWNSSSNASPVREASREVDAGGRRRSPATSGSLPVNIPDRPKILKGNRERESVENDDEAEDRGEIRIPPHEYLARTRGASFSVQEGIGRTLKGRDLRSVRNAIWKKVGFED
ncbi:uncharacterized protein LOC114732024 [Neltuma alba]|uniref:uncharacterized protein LOC114732024 n=1 Tax=Neltuma alba TaxID=207710 RepID=UPI0010A35CD1|nr:uncharacterized protein LOC114732024 [Prosopis alba]